MGDTIPKNTQDLDDATPEIPNPSRSYRPFVAEVLVSAGPRKSSYGYEHNPTYAELCEDCAGVCWVGNRLIFWLCDGASDGMVLLPLAEKAGEKEMPPVFGFSARILAQDLGQAFVEYLCQALPHIKDLKKLTLPSTIFAAVAKSWDHRMVDFVSHVEQRGRRNKLVDALPQTIDGINIVEWSSTFVGGVLDPEEQSICIVNFGDSGALVVTSPPSAIQPNENPVRLHARIEPTTPLSSNVELCFSEEGEWQHFIGVEGFILLSDGIDRLSPLLNRLKDKEFTSLLELRTHLLRKATRTWDDKVVVFGRFISGATSENSSEV